MENNKLWPKRLIILDVSRGLASLIVVVWHWQHFAFQGDTLPENFDRASQPFYLLLRIFYEKGLMAVNYFFLLSGFIFFWLYRSSIENKELSFKGFWVQRISRLYPLHILTLFLVGILQIVYIAKTGLPFVYPYNDIYHFILNLGFAGYWGFEKGFSFNGPSWSVSIEVLLYFFFFISSYRHQGQASFCLINSIISFIISQLLPLPILQGLSVFYFGGFVFYITRLISEGPRKSRGVIYSIAILSWVLILINFYALNLSGLIEHFGFIGQVVLNGFPIYVLFPFTICSLALIEIDKGQFLKPISWVGDITYSSYLLHFPLQLLFAIAVSYNALNNDFYLHPVYLILFFAVLISLSYSTFIHFERPMQDKIRNYFTVRPNPVDVTQ